MSVIEINMLGVDVAAILLILFSAVQVGREFQGKMIQTYLMAVPDRTRYFGAKLMMFFLLLQSFSRRPFRGPSSGFCLHPQYIPFREQHKREV
ncbi:hypothetical protein HNQ56_000084 [Anaerotaenia torta]|uniref:hypothetical protein n=1 Tax=Anaerotaenia torta TaxID=433293 RepID=UPI003D1C5FCC